jgi:hypothetical protein
MLAVKRRTHTGN